MKSTKFEDSDGHVVCKHKALIEIEFDGKEWWVGYSMKIQDANEKLEKQEEFVKEYVIKNIIEHDLKHWNEADRVKFVSVKLVSVDIRTDDGDNFTSEI